MSWLIVILGLMAMILLHELGHFVAAKKFNILVTRFFVFFPPTLFSRTRGETEYGIGLIPLGGFCSIAGMTPDDSKELPEEDQPRAYSNQPVWKRVTVILAGPAVNIVLALILIFIAELLGGGPAKISVDHVVAGSPAAAAGLTANETILKVDGIDADTEVLTNQIAKHKCAGAQMDGCRSATPVTLTVSKDGRPSVIQVWPRYSAKYKQPHIGVYFKLDQTPAGAGRALGETFSTGWYYTAATGKMLGTFYQSKTRKQVSGIVGITRFTDDTVKHRSLSAVLLIFGLVSLSLGLLNLLPFLPLDGGHVVWALAEKIRGRPLSVLTMYRYSLVGILLIGFLVITGLQNDLHL